MQFKADFRPSEFRIFECLSFCFSFSFNRATSSPNLKLRRCCPSTFMPSDISDFLKILLTIAVYSLGETGSTCQVTLF